jgi:phosphoribosylanthranilate isomerase
MFVKICGLTNREDALAAVDAGARALGFIFYHKSPRAVTGDQIQAFVHDIPKEIWKVGVFVNEAPAKIEEIGAALGLDVAQLHGAENPDQHPRGLRVWKAFRVPEGSAPSVEAAVNAGYPAEAILLDGPASGRPFDWSIGADFPGKLIVAGGLDENNVGQAVARARPWGVDVSSGIESAPGRKDHARMKRFIAAALNEANRCEAKQSEAKQ